MPRIEISIPGQSLTLLEDGREVRRYVVSTSRNGPGEQQGSFCTPRGQHIVRAKIGAGQSANAVFVRRRPTGEIWTPELGERFPGRDWILTRILRSEERRVGKEWGARRSAGGSRGTECEWGDGGRGGGGQERSATSVRVRLWSAAVVWQR